MVGILCVSGYVYEIMYWLPSCNVTGRRKYPEKVSPNEKRADCWHCVYEGTLEITIFQSLLLLSGYNEISSLALPPTLCLHILTTALKWHTCRTTGILSPNKPTVTELPQALINPYKQQQTGVQFLITFLLHFLKGISYSFEANLSSGISTFEPHVLSQTSKKSC